MDEMGLGAELHTALFQGLPYSLNVGHLEIHLRSALGSLRALGDADEQPHSAGLEEAHLRRRREQEAEAKRVTVERDRAFEACDGNEQLPHGRVGQIHSHPPVLYVSVQPTPADRIAS